MSNQEMRQSELSTLKAVLGPTNTGKTHYAVERLCAHSSGIMGFPLRLLAREVYDRVVAIKGPASVGLITGEERIMPHGARWILSTVESMPTDRDVAFVALDEAQLGIDPDRGHVFTDRMLHARGREETLILGSETIKPLIRALLPEAEFIHRARFSDLSYAAPKKISRLPPRSAIIAFSADEVYAIAEMVRRNCGGAAIVMGSLSPRTRNAQVAMYQSGEVDYIVATDAIGMGLNMDIGHVAFAGLSKFDGTRRRRLTVNEMAQIAGRAGRHQRDGTFGIAICPGEVTEFSPAEIDRIEGHRFAPQNWHFWRNSALDFSSPETLSTTLEAPPPLPELRASPIADDHKILLNLMSDPAITALVRDQAMTMRLWEACGLPDFRSVGAEFHTKLVARLFHFLGSGNGHIPTQMIADEVARLDSVQGNISTLSGRLASVRTWTYIANRSDWLKDPVHWAARTREVEERLSDTLHRQLTERFVDKRSSLLLRSRGLDVLPGDFQIDGTGHVSMFEEPVGRLAGFRFVPEKDARSGPRKRFLAAAEAALPAELARRVIGICAAPHSSFELRLEPGAKAEVRWRGGIVATLKRGRGLLTPDLQLDASVERLEVVQREAVRSRLGRFVAEHIQGKLRPLILITDTAFSPETPSLVRATLAPIAEAGGVILRRDVNVTLQGLTADERKTLRKLGLVIGSLGIFHPKLIKPGAMHLRIALEAVRSNRSIPPVPMPGLGLLDHPPQDLAAAAQLAGFYSFGDQMLRFDLLEKIALKIHEQRRGHAPFEPDTKVAAALGVGSATLMSVLRALGFVPVGPIEQKQWRWRGLRREAPDNRRLQSPAFRKVNP